MIATEQYPKGLKQTVKDLRDKMDELNALGGENQSEGSKKMAEIFPKSNFSMLTNAVVSHFESLVSDPMDACVVLFGVEVSNLILQIYLHGYISCFFLLFYSADARLCSADGDRASRKISRNSSSCCG